MVNEIILEIGKQIGAKELKFAKFNLCADDIKNEVTVIKGNCWKTQKFVKIQYVQGLDLYTVTKGKIKDFVISEEQPLEGIYNDQLRQIISEHFKFEYVMDSIFGVQQ